MTKSKKEKKVKKVETKNEKFRRLASMRVSKALHTIDLVGNLSGSSYEYSIEEVNKIFSVFNTQLKAVYERFQPKKDGPKKEVFSL